MKRMKVWLMMALCAVIASCTANEEEGLGMDGSQTIVLKIGSAVDTKAVETPGTSSDKATLTNGYMFFATSKGAIRRCYKLLESGKGSTDIAKLEILVTDITGVDGYTFDNVPGDVAKVYILANVPETGETAEATIRSKTTLDAVKALNIQVTDQKTYASVTMDGSGDVTPTSGEKRTATVNLKVFCSRLEIPSLTASGDITSFKVKGIYVSHFYKQVPLTEKVVADQLYKYTEAGKGDYSSTYSMLADVDDGSDGLGETSGKTVSAGDSKTWAYQFIPGASGADREGIRVVIALSDIKGTGTYEGTQYLNIRGLVANDNNDPNPTAMLLERGKIYNMGANLTFDEGDLSPVPNPDDISLTVKITVTPWGVETVKPIL